MDELLPLVRKNLFYYGNKAAVIIRDLRCSMALPNLVQPIIIVGCSRAGTTLVYKTFSESRELGSLQKETHEFWADLHSPAERGWDTHAIPIEYTSDADRDYVTRYFYTNTGKTRIVDKNNQNGLSIPYLHRLFPDAHFVFIKRSPGDNINSLIHGWGKSDEYGYWSDALPEKVSIDNGEYRNWCFFLANGWREYRNAPIEEVCAFQYRAMNNAILSAKNEVPEKQWHELCYEKLIADPVAEFQKVIEACDLTFDKHLKRHCSGVIRNPYNAFSEIKIDKWKDGKNSEKVKLVLPLVRQVAADLGYITPTN